uniref:Uncharacterized protein n=1 Tax=Arundo donax TaxID=35708 RepID=A0A0A8ZJ52_ARUDO
MGSKYGGGFDRLIHPPTHVAAPGTADHLADLEEEDVWSVGGGDSNNHRSGSGSGSALTQPARRSLAALQQQNVAGSAPVSVPEWPSTSRTGESELVGGEWVPPHEYLRQRRGGRGSVVEGAGRTLKGRDICRVRDAVWSKTGFFG